MISIAGRIVTPERVRRGALLIEGGRIRKIAASPGADKGWDFGDALIVPGFIDVHMHGLGEYGAFETVDIIGAAALAVTFGATGFLPGVGSLSEERYLQLGRNVREAQHRAKPGSAAIIGAHFEGPFINPARKGGMDADYLRPPDVAECRRYLAEVGDVLKLMTLSPELDGALEVIRLIREHDVVASLGHSDAGPEDVQPAVEAGLTHVCHLFNTFDKPVTPEADCWPRSLLTTILATDALSCELICDMQHVSPEYVRIAANVLGPDRFIAITDAMTGAGLPPGTYEMVDGRRYSTQSGAARLLENDLLVGSVLTMNRAFGNLVDVVGIDPVLAARFTATNAARTMGIDAEVGAIEPGKRADLAVLNDACDCIATFLNGELVHEV